MDKLKRYTDAVYDDCLQYYERLINKCVPEGKTAIAILYADVIYKSLSYRDDILLWESCSGIYEENLRYFVIPLTKYNLASLDQMQSLQNSLDDCIGIEIPNWYSPQINFIVTSVIDPPFLESSSKTMRINKAMEDGEFLNYFLMSRDKLTDYPEINKTIEDPDFTELTLVDNELLPLLETNISEIKTEAKLFDEIELTWYKAESIAEPGKFTIETSNMNIEIETKTPVFFDVILRRMVDNAISLGIVDKKNWENMIKPYCDKFKKQEKSNEQN